MPECDINLADLFSGIGGFPRGAWQADIRVDNHYYSETDQDAAGLYQKRFPDAMPLGDIREIDCEKLIADAERKSFELRRGSGTISQEKNGDRQEREIDESGPSSGDRRQDWIVCGGFPCQDISIAGRGAGLEGDRSGLWFEMLRVIGGLRPKYVIIENVGAITIARRVKALLVQMVSLLFGQERIGRYIDWPRKPDLLTVLEGLAEIGYDAEWQDIRAEDMGAPHRRERIWIVAYPNSDSAGLQERWGPESIPEKQSSAQYMGEEMADSPGAEIRSGHEKNGTREQDETDRSGNSGCDVPDTNCRRQQISPEQHGESKQNTTDRDSRGRHIDRHSDEISDTISKHDDDSRHGAGEICRERSEEAEVLGSISDSSSNGREQAGIREEKSPRAGGKGEVTDTARPIGESGTGRRGIRQSDTEINGSYWPAEPAICGVDDGLPAELVKHYRKHHLLFEGRTTKTQKNRVSRLRGLGNSIVPQIAELLFRQIKGIE